MEMVLRVSGRFQRALGIQVIEARLKKNRTAEERK